MFTWRPWHTRLVRETRHGSYLRSQKPCENLHIYLNRIESQTFWTPQIHFKAHEENIIFIEQKAYNQILSSSWFDRSFKPSKDLPPYAYPPPSSPSDWLEPWSILRFLSCIYKIFLRFFNCAYICVLYSWLSDWSAPSWDEGFSWDESFIGSSHFP